MKNYSIFVFDKIEFEILYLKFQPTLINKE